MTYPSHRLRMAGSLLSAVLGLSGCGLFLPPSNIELERYLEAQDLIAERVQQQQLELGELLSFEAPPLPAISTPAKVIARHVSRQRICN